MWNQNRTSIDASDCFKLTEWNLTGNRRAELIKQLPNKRCTQAMDVLCFLQPVVFQALRHIAAQRCL